MEILEDMNHRLHDLFEFFDEDPAGFLDDVYRDIPEAWLDRPMPAPPRAG